MNRYGLGAAVVLAGVVSMWLFGTALWGQAPPVGSVNTPVHSIKITLYEQGGACRIAPIADAGFYAGDSVVWNVENGCTTPVTITVKNLKQIAGEPRALFQGDIGLPGELSLPAKSRTHRVASANNQAPPPPAPPNEYDYDVEQNAPSGPTIKGKAHFCREPPCPPRP